MDAPSSIKAARIKSRMYRVPWRLLGRLSITPTLVQRRCVYDQRPAFDVLISEILLKNCCMLCVVGAL